MNVNLVCLVGRLTRKPELRYTQSQTAVCTFGVAVNRKWKTDKGEHEETLFIDCTAWQGRGEAINKYCDQGDSIYVNGYLRTESWEDKNTGDKRSKISLVVEDFQFGPKRSKEGK